MDVNNLKAVCENKKRFNSAWSAMKFAQKCNVYMREHCKPEFRVYHCRVCGGFHLTSVEKKKGDHRTETTFKPRSLHRPKNSKII